MKRNNTNPRSKTPSKGTSLLKTRHLSYVAGMSGSQHRSIFFLTILVPIPTLTFTTLIAISQSLTFFAFLLWPWPFALMFFPDPLFSRMCKGCRHSVLVCINLDANTQQKNLYSSTSPLFSFVRARVGIVHKADFWSEVQGAGRDRPSFPFFFLVYVALIRYVSAFRLPLITRTSFILCCWETE